MSQRPRVFTFPSSRPFLHDLAKLMLNGSLVAGFNPLEAPITLLNATIYLPHRRACRAFKDILTDDFNVKLLPRILPLGDAENDWDLLDPNPLTYLGLEELKPALPQEERLLILTRLIKKWSEGQARAASLFDCLGLAEKLSQLMDQMLTEHIGWDALKTIKIDDLEGKFDQYWSLSRGFLEILSEHWQAILDDKNVIDTAERRTLLLKAEGLRLFHSPHPVIAAGSTGSIYATRELLKQIALHPQGCVVLPHFDLSLTDEIYEAVRLESGHPHYGLKRLLTHIGVDKNELFSPLQPLKHGREALLSRTFLPASFTHLWQEKTDYPSEMLDGVTLFEANDEREEALAISFYAKQHYLKNLQPITIVTPDKALTTRIVYECSQLGLSVDKSQGLSLADSPCFITLRLLLKCLSATKPHPIDMLSYYERVSPEVAPFFNMALRGKTPSFTQLKSRLQDEALAALEVLETLHKTFYNKSFSLKEWVLALQPLLSESEGQDELLTLFQALKGDEAEGLLLHLQDVELFLLRLVAAKTMRGGYNKTAQVRILGLPEARLVEGDTLILAGLNEATFPMQTETDPWLNRAMKGMMGLEPPERRIGLAAHDFMQAFNKPNVLVTRSLKKDNTPTIASRWLLRLKAVLGDKYQELLNKGEVYKQIITHVEQVAATPYALRPAPKPPLEARPLSLSITEIEKLYRDPYFIYAKHILKLKPLEGFAESVDAGDKGSAYHAIIENYTKLRNKGAMNNPLEVMMGLAEQEFSPFFDDHSVKYFWLPRFKGVAEKLIALDELARKKGFSVYVEVSGSVNFPLLSNREFTLKGRADRIEHDGVKFNVVDYKSGNIPTKKQVNQFFSPQLPLTAALFLKGAFKGVPPASEIAGLGYIGLKIDKGDLKKVQLDEVETLTHDTFDHLVSLLNAFENGKHPYTSKLVPATLNEASDYDHLARVDEWRSFQDYEEVPYE